MVDQPAGDADQAVSQGGNHGFVVAVFFEEAQAAAELNSFLQ